MKAAADKGYFTIRLADTMREALEAMAAENERTVSAEIRLAIREHLEKEGDAA